MFGAEEGANVWTISDQEAQGEGEAGGFRVLNLEVRMHGTKLCETCA